MSEWGSRGERERSHWPIWPVLGLFGHFTGFRVFLKRLSAILIPGGLCWGGQGVRGSGCAGLWGWSRLARVSYSKVGFPLEKDTWATEPYPVDPQSPFLGQGSSPRVWVLTGSFSGGASTGCPLLGGAGPRGPFMGGEELEPHGSFPFPQGVNSKGSGVSLPQPPERFTLPPRIIGRGQRTPLPHCSSWGRVCWPVNFVRTWGAHHPEKLLDIASQWCPQKWC